MPSTLNPPGLRDARALLRPLRAQPAAKREWQVEAVGDFFADGGRHEIPRLRLMGAYAGHDPIRLAFFAGIHGDEPAGCTALVQFAGMLADDPARTAGYELFIYPILNPTGYAANTRANHAGKDLNREFWRDSVEPEIRLIERELRAHRFDGLISLHADDTCEGLYGYAHGKTLNEALLVPALRAGSRWLPLDRRAVIDGFAAREGLICDCFQGVLAAPPDQRPRPFDLIIETPAHAPPGLQVAAAVAALETIVATYPGFISYAQDL